MSDDGRLCQMTVDYRVHTAAFLIEIHKTCLRSCCVSLCLDGNLYGGPAGQRLQRTFWVRAIREHLSSIWNMVDVLSIILVPLVLILALNADVQSASNMKSIATLQVYDPCHSHDQNTLN